MHARLESRARPFGALVCILVALGCGEPQSRSGTNTNWLRVCQADADCGDALACLCGRCTQHCEADGDCPSGSTCAASAAAQLQCRGEATRTCQPGCSGADDCAPDQLCYHGACTDRLPTAACPADALICEDFEAAWGGYDQIVTEGNSLAREQVPTPSGDWALAAVVTAAPSVAYLRAPLATTTSGALSLRGWVQVPDQDAHDMAPFGFWSAAEEAWALRLVIKDARLELWSYTQPLTSPVALVPGSWHCLEAIVSVAEAPDGEVEVRVDGEPVGMATEVDTLPTGGIDSLLLGTVWAGAPATIHVDRVLLSSRATTCWE